MVVNHALLLTDAISSNRILPGLRHTGDRRGSPLRGSGDDPVHDQSRRTGRVWSWPTPFLATTAWRIRASWPEQWRFFWAPWKMTKSQRQARKAQKQLDAAKACGRALRSSSASLFASLELIHAESAERSNGFERTRRVTTATRAAPAWQAVETAWDQLLTALREAESILRWFATAVADVDDVAVADLAEAGERQQLLLSDLVNTMRVGTELAAKFASALDSPESERVFWLERVGPTNRLVFPIGAA